MPAVAFLADHDRGRTTYPPRGAIRGVVVERHGSAVCDPAGADAGAIAAMAAARAKGDAPLLALGSTTVVPPWPSLEAIQVEPK